MGLPSGYKLVEYIESTGTQYIDTGITYNSANEYIIETECRITSDGKYSGWNAGGIFGSQNGYWDCGTSALGLSASVMSVVKLTIESGSSSNSVLEVTQAGETQSRSRAHGSIASYAGMNYPIFAYTDNSGGLNGYAVMRLTYMQITVNGILVRDFVPCINASNEAGLYDLVNNVFYGNAGTGIFTVGAVVSLAYNAAVIDGVFRKRIDEYGIIAGIARRFVAGYMYDNGVWRKIFEVKRLPTGYTELEYIQSSGTQHIDTGFKPNSDTRILIDYESLASGVAFVFGSRHNSSANSASKSFSFVILGSTSVRSDYGSIESGITGTVQKRVILDKDKNITTYDGNTVSANAQTFDSSYNLYLCSVNTAGTAGAKASIKIYSCQIYDNGVLVRDFVPCKNTNGEIGLYDLVNDMFYGNSGTGSFTAE